MPAVKGTKQDKATIAELKLKFLDYYREVPIQKYAAQWIRRNEQTVSDWKAADPDFANAIQEMQALFVQKNVMKTKADWKLERMLRESFGQSVDITSKGEKITPIFGGNSVQGDDRDKQGVLPPQED